MTNVQIVSGDITQQPADALITAINSEGMWFGGIDGAIQRVAGSMFHAQARNAAPLVDGAALLAGSIDGHRGKFANVIFIIDDLRQPLRNIVSAGLQKAEESRFAEITLPTIRTGVMAGVVEPTVEAALDEMVSAIKAFMATDPKYVRSITIVVYNDAHAERYLAKQLADI